MIFIKDDEIMNSDKILNEKLDKMEEYLNDRDLIDIVISSSILRNAVKFKVFTEREKRYFAKKLNKLAMKVRLLPTDERVIKFNKLTDANIA